MTCFPRSWWNQSVARSMHSGGLFAAFADGSVHFVSDYIDIAGDLTANPPRFSVWDRINLSADNATVTSAQF